MAGIVSPVCKNSLHTVLDLYGMLGVLSYVVKFYCCLNMADMDRLLCGKLWSEQC